MRMTEPSPEERPPVRQGRMRCNRESDQLTSRQIAIIERSQERQAKDKRLRTGDVQVDLFGCETPQEFDKAAYLAKKREQFDLIFMQWLEFENAFAGYQCKASVTKAAKAIKSLKAALDVEPAPAESLGLADP